MQNVRNSSVSHTYKQIKWNQNLKGKQEKLWHYEVCIGKSCISSKESWNGETLPLKHLNLCRVLTQFRSCKHILYLEATHRIKSIWVMWMHSHKKNDKIICQTSGQFPNSKKRNLKTCKQQGLYVFYFSISNCFHKKTCHWSHLTHKGR